MRGETLQYRRNGLEAVEQEMDRLMTAGLPASIEERQACRNRLAVLVEGREAAARFGRRPRSETETGEQRSGAG